MTKELTLEKLKSILKYDEISGDFIYISAPARKIKIGDVVGTVEKNGYIRIEISGRPYRAHRLAWFYMTGEWPKYHIDHINLDKGDNRFANLREATRSDNMGNVGLQRDNKTGAKGVHKTKFGYIAQLRTKEKTQYLGTFQTVEDAKEAYRVAAENYFGEFARIV